MLTGPDVVVERLIPAGAEAEWAALSAALLELDGGGPVCRREPEGWWVTRSAALEAAARRCFGCPVIRECGAYAVAAREREGVWGGMTPAERDVLRQGAA